MFISLFPALINSFFAPQLLPEQFEPYSEISISVAPIKKDSEIMPILRSKSALAIDLDSHEILFKKNINEKLAFASLVKLMVAIIILEENDLNEVITIKENLSSIEGSKVWLNQGEKFTFEELLYLLLIPSGNDAAVALAQANSGSANVFIEKMNKKARFLGLNDTIFTNPIGLDDGLQKSTAKDLANLSLYVLENPVIRKIVKLDKVSVMSESGIIRNVENTNKLLHSYLDVQGLKTGTTDDAGQCFISLAKNKDGHEILAVVLSSDDRFQDAKVLIDWVWRTYEW